MKSQQMNDWHGKWCHGQCHARSISVSQLCTHCCMLQTVSALFQDAKHKQVYWTNAKINKYKKWIRGHFKEESVHTINCLVLTTKLITTQNKRAKAFDKSCTEWPHTHGMHRVATFALSQSRTGVRGYHPGKFLEFHMRFGAFWGNLVAVICRPSDRYYGTKTL